MCSASELTTGACCEESSGLSTCGFSHTGVWTRDFCTSVQTCAVAERFQYVSNKVHSGGCKECRRGDTLNDRQTAAQCATGDREKLCVYSVKNRKRGLPTCLPAKRIALRHDNSGDYGWFVMMEDSKLKGYQSKYNVTSVEPIPGFRGGIRVLSTLSEDEVAAVVKRYGRATPAFEKRRIFNCVEENSAVPVPTNMGVHSPSAYASRRLVGASRRYASPVRSYVYVVDTGVFASHGRPLM